MEPELNKVPMPVAEKRALDAEEVPVEAPMAMDGGPVEDAPAQEGEDAPTVEGEDTPTSEDEGTDPVEPTGE